MSIYDRISRGARIATPFPGVMIAPLAGMTITMIGGRDLKPPTEAEQRSLRNLVALNWPGNLLPPPRPEPSRFVRTASPGECRAVRLHWLPADARCPLCGGQWREHPRHVHDCSLPVPPRRPPDWWCPACGERAATHVRLSTSDAASADGQPATDRPELHDVVDDGHLRRPRDVLGRFVRDAQSEDDPPPASPAEEWQLEQQARRQARDLLTHARRGTKRQLARMLGYRGRWALHTVRQLCKGAGPIPAACRRRIEMAYTAFKRGELVCVETDRLGADGKPLNTWRLLQPVPGIRVPPRRRPGRPRKAAAPVCMTGDRTRRYGLQVAPDGQVGK